MPVSQLGDMTWEDLRGLEKANAVAILPTGAMEAHGPHLPLSTDVVIAEAMARAGGERLAQRGCNVVILPSVAYTAAEFGAGFPGTISIDPAAVNVMLMSLLRSLARSGLGVVALANAHLDPAHLSSLHAVVRQCRDIENVRCVFPDITRRPWASRLTDEFKSGACHAGQFESSIVMAARPELVRDALRRQLAPNPASLSAAIKDGATTFEKAGGPRAYFGFPADASADEGRRTIDVLGAILEEAVMNELGDGQANARDA